MSHSFVIIVIVALLVDGLGLLWSSHPRFNGPPVGTWLGALFVVVGLALLMSVLGVL